MPIPKYSAACSLDRQRASGRGSPWWFSSRIIALVKTPRDVSAQAALRLSQGGQQHDFVCQHIFLQHGNLGRTMTEVWTGARVLSGSGLNQKMKLARTEEEGLALRRKFYSRPALSV